MHFVTAALYTLMPAITILVTPLPLTGQCCSLTASNCSDESIERSYRHGRWFVVETQNFQVCCVAGQGYAGPLAVGAEKLRLDMASKWLGNRSPKPWIPKCQIVVHSDRSSYVSAAGRGSERTAGSSLVRVVRGRILSRRIDLLSDGSAIRVPALPHELTHVVLKDRFPAKELPRWADEGVAILADSDAKQKRHDSDLKEAIRSRTTFHAVSLLTLEGYPQPKQWGVFYAQSNSVVRFLVDRKSPEQFIDFVEHASSSGYDLALRSCYGITDISSLDREWRRSTAKLLNRPYHVPSTLREQ